MKRHRILSFWRAMILIGMITYVLAISVGLAYAATVVIH